MIELKPYEVNLSNGAPYTSPPEKEPTDSNEAFYATDLSGSEDPIGTYESIIIESMKEGESSFIKALKYQFEKEQDAETQFQLENLIVDPDLSRQEKREALESYLYRNKVPINLQKKYIEKVSNENIIENSLDQSDEAIEEQMILEEDADMQAVWQDIYDKAVENKINPTTSTFDNKVENLNDSKSKVPDTETIDISPLDNLAFIGNMILGEGFSWVTDIYESFDKYYKNNLKTNNNIQLPTTKAFSLLLDYLKEGTASLDPKKVKKAQQILDKEENQYGHALSNLTKIFDYTSKRNRAVYDSKDKGLSVKWAEFVREFLNSYGFSDEEMNKTLAADLMVSLDKGLTAVSNKLNPEDPMLVRLPLELLIGLVGPKGVKYTYKGAKYAKNMALVGRPGAKLISNIEKINLERKPIAVGETGIELQGSKDVSINPNSPIAITLKTNPKKAGKMMEVTLQDGTMEVGDVIFNNTKKSKVQWTPRTIVMHLMDGNSSMFKTNNFGWITDSSVLRELQLMSEYNALQRVTPVGARDIKARRLELDNIVSALNDIDPAIRMIPSKSFSKFDPIPEGFDTNLVFRRSSQEDYGTIFEAFDSYSELKRSLRDTLGLDIKQITKELSIIEYDKLGNEIRTITEKNINSILKNEPTIKQGIFRIHWTRPKSLYDGFFGEVKSTPSDRFPGISGFILRGLYNLGSSMGFGSKSDWATRYGKFEKIVEDAYFSQDLAKEAFFKLAFDRLQHLYKKEMNTTEQRQFSKLLRWAELNYKDRVTGGEINHIIGNGTLTAMQVQKFQTALNSYRVITNELHGMRQIIARRELHDKGYTRSFYYIDPNTKLREPIAVKEDFQFNPQQDFVNIVRPEDPVQVYSYEIWDMTTNKPILHKPQNQGKPGTHFLRLEDGTPTQQIYQLANRFKAPDGNFYNFATFGTVKPGILPRELSPRIPGYIPKIHLEAIIVKRYPLFFKVNGKQQNYRNRKDQAIADLESYSESIRLFVSRKDANAYKARQEQVNGENYAYTVDTVAELKSKGKMFSDEQIRRHNLQTNKQRTGIEYELMDDPYSSLIQTAQITGANVLDIVGLGQLKIEFVRAIENNPYINVNWRREDGSKIPEKGIGRLEDRFPSRDQILEVAGHENVHKHFLKLWDEIYIYEMGQARGDISNAVAKLGEWMAEGSDFVGGGSAIGKTFVKGGRWIQRNPQAAAGSPLKPITSLWIMMRPVKQFILQSMASAGPIAVVSNYNPVQIARIYSNAVRLSMTRIKNQRNMKKGRPSDLDKQIDMFWDMSQGLYKDLGSDIKSNTSKFKKLEVKELEFIDLWERRSGTSNTRDHVYNQGIGVNTLPNLSKLNTSGTPIHKLRGWNTASYLNPFMYLEKTSQKFSEWGFELGESINRDLFTLVAIEQFKKQNPKIDWKQDAAMSQIMLDANRMAGGMNKTMAFKWQGNLPLRYLGLFTSFSMKMSERTWNANATPFTGKQRAALLATDFLIYGSSLYNIDKFARNWLMEAEDPDLRAWGEYFNRLNLTYQLANMFGNYLGFEESGVIPGEVLSVHGNAPLGPLTNIYRLWASATGDTMSTKDAGAAAAFYKKILGDNGAVRLIWDLYGNSEALEQQPGMKLNVLKSTITKMIPFMSMLDKMTFAILEDQWLADETRTGHNTGLETTPYEQVFGAVIGAPADRTQLMWDQANKASDKKKWLRAEARRVVTIYRDAINKKPIELDEIKDFLYLWKLKLESETMIANTREHMYFMDEALRIVVQQDNTFADKFYTELKKSFNYSAPYYSESDIETIRNLKSTLSRRYPDSIDELDKMEAWMLDANDQYKKENK